ncbi:MAG: class I SAM-dependent methyltransferase [Micromonosporaceae bacterium]
MTETFQIPIEIAEAYEATFVPALFAEWAGQMLDAADVRPGQRVLDVACGTGVVARGAADRVGPTGGVTGLDLNPAMLEVARRIRPELDWRQGDVAALPYGPASYDRVLCQSSMMFFREPVAALRELGRVAKPDGLVAVQVPGRMESSDGYLRLLDVVARHAGTEATELLRGYFMYGDTDQLRGMFRDAGLRVRDVVTRMAAVRRPTIDEFVTTEVSSTPLIERLTEQQLAQIVADSRTALAGYASTGQGVAIPIEGHIVLAQP